MVAYHKNFLLFCIPPLLIGCASAVPWEHTHMTLIEMQRFDAVSELDEPINPEEMRLWVPPSDTELAMRRKRLKKLLRVSRAVEKVSINFRSVQAEGDSFAATVAAVNSRVNYINDETLARVNKKKEKFNQLKHDTESIESSIKKAKYDIRQLEKVSVAMAVRGGHARRAGYKFHYRKAIQFFRKGKYEKSIQRFLRALSSDHPRFIADDIQFGIGCAHYKLKQYASAIRRLDLVIKKYPGQDKWLSAHVLLGMIYGLDGQKSKSMYILEKALKNDPPLNVRKVLEQLIAITQEEDFYASS